MLALQEALIQGDSSYLFKTSVKEAWVSPGNTPARATTEAKLASPQYTVEIMVIAAR
jgi:enamine deaminase RidA (YjgF/YER057c/UK114 family)